MATAKNEVTVSSDAYFEYVCKQCCRLGNNSEASNFCKDCQEYLCQRCTAYHKVLPITQNHKVGTLDRFILNIKTRTETDVCGLHWIVGLALLPNNTLVVADRYQSKLKIIDTVRHEIISEIKLPRPPVDVAKTSADTVAVALPDKQKILFVRISPKLAKVGGFEIAGETSGLSYNKDKGWLALSFVRPPKVEIVDLTGHVMRVIASRVTQKILTRPNRVVFSRDNKLLYVSDDDDYRKAVVKFNMDGKMLATCTYRMFNNPSGMVACHGDVYMADNSTVYIISSDSNNVKFLLNESDRKRLLCPECIQVSEQEDMLYVGSYGQDAITVFKL